MLQPFVRRSLLIAVHSDIITSPLTYELAVNVDFVVSRQGRPVFIFDVRFR